MVKKAKALLSLILAFMMFFGSFAVVGVSVPGLVVTANAAKADSGENWKVLTTGELIISGKVTTDGTKGSAPWFAQASKITLITIEEEVTEIPEYLFEGTAVKSVYIPASVKTIAKTAFADCDSLEKIYFAGSETEWKAMDIGTVTTLTVEYGHSHTVVIDKAVEATCGKAGKTKGEHCSVCGKVLVAQETVAATDHQIKAYENVPATCVGKGYKNGSYCLVCGKEVSPRQEIAPKGHTWSDAVITSEATAFADGKKSSTCKVCGEKKTETYTLSTTEKIVWFITSTITKVSNFMTMMKKMFGQSTTT